MRNYDWTLFNPQNASNMTASENACLLVNVSIEANSLDSDQTARPDCSHRSSLILIYTVSRRALKHFSRRTTKAGDDFVFAL